MARFHIARLQLVIKQSRFCARWHGEYLQRRLGALNLSSIRCQRRLGTLRCLAELPPLLNRIMLAKACLTTEKEMLQIFICGCVTRCTQTRSTSSFPMCITCMCIRRAGDGLAICADSERMSLATYHRARQLYMRVLWIAEIAIAARAKHPRTSIAPRSLIRRASFTIPPNVLAAVA